VSSAHSHRLPKADELPFLLGQGRHIEATTMVGQSEAQLDHVSAELFTSYISDETDDLEYVLLADSDAYTWDGNLLEDPEGFFEACDIETDDLCTVGEYVLAASRELEELLEFGCSRVIILDAVRVEPAARGNDLGQQIAAHIVRIAGGWSDQAVVLAIAGSREDDTEQIKQAAKGVLLGIGLRAVGDDGLFVGDCSMGPFAESLSDALRMSTLTD
jgi:GNAT superfamily N-acetyltransferase